MPHKPSCCGKAGYSISTSVYDIRKEIFQPDYVRAIDSTLDYNLKEWEDTCPLGYLEKKMPDGKRRCIFVENPYPTYYRSYQDRFKGQVIRSMQKDGTWMPK